MEKLIINEQSGDTPQITLDKEANVFEICGRSFPINTVEFYSPVIKWLKEYAQNPNPQTIFTINLDYVNSSSSKKIFEILMELKHITTIGGNIIVKWYYDENDDGMFTKSKDIQAVLNIPIEFIKKNKQSLEVKSKKLKVKS